MPAAQAREALAVRLPRAERTERETPKALSASQYERLLREAKARIADEPLAGTRDPGDRARAGGRRAALRRARPPRAPRLLPARKGAQLRASTSVTAKATAAAASSSAPPPRGRSCAETANAPAPSAPPPTTRTLFITLGTRRRDGTYSRVGGRCGQGTLADLLKRLGAAAELPAELRHPHALRHTCATELLRAGATIADVREFLGPASVKTTSIYLASGEDRQEHVVRLRERITLDDDREWGRGGLGDARQN